MIVVAKYFLIAMAVIMAVPYGIWIFGGWIADRRGQKALAVLKGDQLRARKRLNY